MGYYTSFDLTLRGEMTKERAEKIVKRINDVMDWEDFFTVWSRKPIEDEANEIRKVWYTDSADTAKWYEWEEDMTRIAKEFPDVEFKLEGSGEERDDWWIALFKGPLKQIEYCEAPFGSWRD